MRSISEALAACDYYQPAADTRPTAPTRPAAPKHPRLLGLVLLALLLSACAASKPEAFNHSPEHAAPVAATR